MCAENSEIDIVVTWVDGNDINHRKKKEKYLIDKNKFVKGGVTDNRFIQSDEIMYCLLSIRKFAPWVRRVFIVTDNQRPKILDDKRLFGLDLRMVDHKELFSGYEEYLPSFNSRTIQSMFWNIKDLSEKYLYFNDDFILSGEVRKEDFFDGGKIVVNGTFKSHFKHKLSEFKKFMFNPSENNSTKNKNSIYLASKSIGLKKKFFIHHHVPYPMSKTFLYSYLNDNINIFENLLRYKFRHSSQPLVSAAYHNYMFKEGKLLLGDKNRLFYLNKNKIEELTFEEIYDTIFKPDTKLLCIQDMESLSDNKFLELKTVLEEICKF